MYTVVRFCAGETCSDETLKEFGARLNSIVAKAYKDRLDHAGRRFSVSVSTEDTWAANLTETLQFIRKTRPLIEEARARGVSVEIDTAVEPKDLQGRLWLSCAVAPEISRELAQAQVTLVLTTYGGVSAEANVE